MISSSPAVVMMMGALPPKSIAVIAACIVYPILSPLRTFAIWRNVWRGLKMGRAAKPLIAIPFERRWKVPVAQLRTELGVAPGGELPVVATPVTT